MDWSVKDRFEKIDLKVSIAHQIVNMIKEDKIKEKIKKRTYSEKCETWSIRSVTFFINVVLVLASWAGIYYVNANYQSIED